ncbi:MAG: hypothetical protein HFACDABA_03057 [Anaerolineales bacterium]|nr:hypothetical protein [Anaerolineales bacterium]
MAKPTLTMKYAGGLIKHLGLQMYSGAVPSIAELIKNAYDANATEVNISIPFGLPWSADSVIVVEDNGHGMSFSDCDDKYLVIGRDRREAEGDTVLGNPKRRPIGRKGIGKLAGFGIADTVNVTTIQNSKRSIFEMVYRDIEKLNLGEEYHPNVIEANVKTGNSPGTTVTLQNIKLQRTINEDEFRYSMARRFSLISGDFVIKVNGKPLKRDEVALQFRFPEKKLQTETITGSGTIQWWIGFTDKPIERDEDRGIVIVVRGTLAQQTPFFFGLTGGFEGQLGLQYITGEIYADFLDQAFDAVATDRGSINWEREEAQPLLAWGKEKVRTLLKEWAKLRRAIQENRLRRETKYIDLIQQFPDRQRDELINAITKLASIPTIEDDRLDELVAFLIEAYQRADVMAIIRQLMKANTIERAQMFEILSEWDVVEAIQFAGIVKGRLAIIDKFEQLIEEGAPEKVSDRDDMQGFLEKHPWLIDNSLALMDHEKKLDSVLVKHFKIESSTKEEGSHRVDFFCVNDANNIVIVEVKGADISAGKKEFRQIIDYVEFFRDEQDKKKSTDPKYPKKNIRGFLIAKQIKDDAHGESSRALSTGVTFQPWEGLADAARRSNQEFYRIVKQRANAKDPRIEALENLDKIL